jgi:hypothetical protein
MSSHKAGDLKAVASLKGLSFDDSIGHDDAQRP